MTGESRRDARPPVGPIGGEIAARRGSAIRRRRSSAEWCRSAALRRARAAPRRSRGRRRDAAAGQRRRRGPARHRAAAAASAAAMSVTRSATARAVVYFVPATLIRCPRCRRRAWSRTCSCPSSATRPPCSDGRHDAAVDQRDVRERQIERRKRLVQLGDERRDIALGDAGVARIADASPIPTCRTARARATARETDCGPDGERPPSASSPASRLVTRFIAFSIGMPVGEPSGCQQAIDRARRSR